VKKKIGLLFMIVLTALLYAGCSMMTVDQMYRLPKRSETYNDLQSAIDSAMQGLNYSAPLSGENQQNVQLADLDGDGEDEYILFAKSAEEKPLRILVFRISGGQCQLVSTVACNGSAFDVVEYANMDGQPGLEMVVGRRLSDQLVRSVSVYKMTDDDMVQLVSVNYTRMLTVDLDANHQSELMVIRPGTAEDGHGVVELYAVKNGAMERYNEVPMSQPADKLKRVILGNLDGGASAVFTASTVDDTAIITDIYTIVDDMLTNVAVSNESGTSIQTMRNFYVYADDLDNDGVVELPSLINMKPLEGKLNEDRHHLIRWYAMTPDGDEVNKLHTFHNFVGGWYVQLDSRWAQRITVETYANQYTFHLWNESYKKTQKLFTVTALTGQNREEQAVADGSFVLLRTESILYTATLEPAAKDLDLTQEHLIFSFRLIRQDWKTGET
jgi:hypothetical protein